MAFPWRPRRREKPGPVPNGYARRSITGLPASRRIQQVSGELLIALWQAAFGVSTARQLRDVKRFGLWESPCGLAFFHPMIVGDEQFYRDFYGRLGDGGPWRNALVQRSDFARVATLIAPGEKVLDVGCGTACFARHAEDVIYVRLEQNVTARSADVRSETVAQHAAEHPGAYDVVCSFHVAEHTSEPALFVADMVRCLRPGGAAVPRRAEMAVGAHRHPQFRPQWATTSSELVEQPGVARFGRACRTDRGKHRGSPAEPGRQHHLLDGVADAQING